MAKAQPSSSPAVAGVRKGTSDSFDSPRPAASGTAANDIVVQLSPNYWVYDADVDVAGRGAVMVDHVIAIVGWDNTYSRWNFATPLIDDATGRNRAYDPEIAEVATGKDGEDYIVPIMDGAWIVKNSWGTEDSEPGATLLMGDEGIFYFSYCEKTIAQPTTMVPDEAASDDLPYDETYQYDASTASTIFDDPFEVLGANVFTATGSQSIDALGVWVTEYDTTLDIRVYANLSDASDPESGTLVSSQREYVPSFGWYTVDLDQPVSVSEGETFSVVASWNAPPSSRPLKASSAIPPHRNHISSRSNRPACLKVPPRSQGSRLRTRSSSIPPRHRRFPTSS